MKKVLFVCLGNICRSPMAEAILENMVKAENLSDKISCDSAGTANYHVGNEPDYRTVKTLAIRGISTAHLGKQFRGDFSRFDQIFAMDKSNFYNIVALAKSPADKAKVKMMREFDDVPTDDQVPDPYYGSIQDFENVYEMLERCCRNYLTSLKSENL